MRLSGTEPLVRVYAETRERAHVDAAARHRAEDGGGLMETRVIETGRAHPRRRPRRHARRASRTCRSRCATRGRSRERSSSRRRYGDVRNIVVAGMGGSAIGGDLAAALLLGELKVPMSVHRDYGLPAYVGRDSLRHRVLVFRQHRGDAHRSAKRRRSAARRSCASRPGGKIAQIAQATGIRSSRSRTRPSRGPHSATRSGSSSACSARSA